MSGSSQQLNLKKGAPGDQVLDLLCVQLTSYLEGGPLMWIMRLHVNQKSNDDDDDDDDDGDDDDDIVTYCEFTNILKKLLNSNHQKH